MPDADAMLLAQALAVVAAGTAGACALGIGAAASTRVLGVGLVVAAALAAIDTMTVAGRGLPLAGFAMFVFACLATGPRGSRLAEVLAATPLRLAVAGTAAALLLHQAHVVAPHQTGVEIGVTWYGLDLATAIGLGWLAVRRRELAVELRFVLAAQALGLAATSYAHEGRAMLGAATFALGCAGVLWRGLAEAPRCFAVAAASTGAIALACALRASAVAHGTSLAFAGLDDPLLVLAALFAVFGVALHRDHVALAAGTAAGVDATADAARESEPPPEPAPLSDPAPTSASTSTCESTLSESTLSEPIPMSVPAPASELAPTPDPAAQCEPASAAESAATNAPAPADVIELHELPDEADAARMRAEAEAALSELLTPGETPERERAAAPASTDAV